MRLVAGGLGFGNRLVKLVARGLGFGNRLGRLVTVGLGFGKPASEASSRGLYPAREASSRGLGFGNWLVRLVARVWVLVTSCIDYSGKVYGPGG